MLKCFDRVEAATKQKIYNMEYCGNTTKLGWQVHLECYTNRHRGDVYFEVQAVLEYLEIKKHTNKHGFIYIDKFLFDNGVCPYRRGNTVYFSSSECSPIKRGMMIDLTPLKQHARVATTSKERPLRVPLDDIKEPPPQPLANYTFVISGNISERNEREKMTTDKLSVTIENLGGTVYTKDIEKAVEASFIVITSQKEVNKPINKINKTLIMAYRLGWPIVSKQIILSARDTNAMPSTNEYVLDLSNLKNAPATSVVHAKVMTRGHMVDNFHVVGAHRELKKKLRNSKRTTREESATEVKRKHPPKKKCTAYVMFSRSMYKAIVKDNPVCKMSEVNSLISQMWKELDEDQKQFYKDQAIEHFEQLTEQFDKENVQHDDRSSI